MRYTDLIFDLYGTLVDIHTEENELVWDKTALYLGYYGANYTGASLQAAFRKEMSRREAQAGQSYEMFPDIPFNSVLADLLRAQGVTEQVDTLALNAAQVFRVASTEYIRLYDGVLDALDKLRARGFRLWLLSNAQRAFTAYELRYLGLTDKFDGIYLSSDYQCRKPDVRFFRALLDEQGLDPHTCLMIGNDRDTDIAGAQAAGISTLYMHTNLTPAEQKEANPELNFDTIHTDRRFLEFEGARWSVLANIICTL